MQFIENDGGRRAAGFKGNAGDCVCRAIAIASGRPYKEVYDALAHGNANQRVTRRSKKAGRKSARNGIYVRCKWFKDYMATLGFKWTPTMGIGTGCQVHLHDGELPMGRLVVSVSGHYTCVINGVVHDMHNPQRDWHRMDFNGASSSNDPRVTHSIQRRCVYGYWRLAGSAP